MYYTHIYIRTHTHTHTRRCVHEYRRLQNSTLQKPWHIHTKRLEQQEQQSNCIHTHGIHHPTTRASPKNCHRPVWSLPPSKVTLPNSPSLAGITRFRPVLFISSGSTNHPESSNNLKTSTRHIYIKRNPGHSFLLFSNAMLYQTFFPNVCARIIFSVLRHSLSSSSWFYSSLLRDTDMRIKLPFSIFGELYCSMNTATPKNLLIYECVPKILIKSNSVVSSSNPNGHFHVAHT